MLYGLYGLLEVDAAATRPTEWARWWIGADLAHDLVLAPIVCLVGLGLGRLVPKPFWAPVRAGLIGTALVLAVGWAPLRGYGRAIVPDNPTVQPLDYTSAVFSAIAIVWLIVVIWLAATVIARSRTSSLP